MNLNPFEKYMFSKESENSTCWNIDSISCFTLSGFLKGFENLDFFDFVVKPIQPVDLWFQSIDFLKILTEFC